MQKACAKILLTTANNYCTIIILRRECQRTCIQQRAKTSFLVDRILRHSPYWTNNRSTMKSSQPLQIMGSAIAVARIYPLRTIGIVAALIVAGLAEGIGISSILPLLTTATGSEIGDSDIEKMYSALLDFFGLSPKLGVVMTIMVIVMTLKGAFTMLAMSIASIAVAHTSADMRVGLLRSLLRANWPFFQGQPVGLLSNAMGNEANSAAMMVRHTAMLASLFIQILVYFGAAMLVSWKVSVAALVTGAFMFVFLDRLVEFSRKAGQESLIASRGLLARLADAMQGIKPMKAMAIEDQIEPLLTKEIMDLKNATRNAAIARQALVYAQEPILVLFLAIGLMAVHTYSTMHINSLMVMVFLFYRSVSRVGDLQRSYQGIAISREFYNGLLGKMNEADLAVESVVLGENVELRHEIELRNVSFSYGDKQVLRDVSLKIPAGKITTLFGPSGSGKTTAVDLILGFYNVGTGEILIDGRSIQTVNIRNWRGKMGYVPQELFLFHDTIFHNLGLGSKEFSREEAEQALVKAGAWDFVSQLPAGLDTVVGERGSRLSGGQRQRIAIARALIRNPQILILDEPTTALDPETELEICRTLQELGNEVTVIAISHQNALADIAQNLVSLTEGQVIPVSRQTPG
jgi:ATP-binding cassette, subfamily C, bacterial